MKSATSHWQVDSSKLAHPVAATHSHHHVVTSSLHPLSIGHFIIHDQPIACSVQSPHRTPGYSDDEQGPKHAFPGQRVSDRPSAVNTSMSSVTLTTGHGISTLLGLET
jgi:hypothetical protein